MSKVMDVYQKPKTVDLGDGVEREVIFTLNAMAELEEKYGSLEGTMDRVNKGEISAIRFFIWTCLNNDEEHPITEKEVGKKITIRNMNTLVNDIMDALEEQMPEGAMESAQDPNTKTPANVVSLPNSDW